MRIYELINKGYEEVESLLPQISFQDNKVFRRIKNDIELKLEYELESMPFDINDAYFSILLQDIHNNIPCGTLFVFIPVGEGIDTIIYTVRFDETEFEQIKKFT